MKSILFVLTLFTFGAFAADTFEFAHARKYKKHKIWVECVERAENKQCQKFKIRKSDDLYPEENEIYKLERWTYTKEELLKNKELKHGQLTMTGNLSMLVIGPYGVDSLGELIGAGLFFLAFDLPTTPVQAVVNITENLIISSKLKGMVKDIDAFMQTGAIGKSRGFGFKTYWDAGNVID